MAVITADFVNGPVVINGNSYADVPTAVASADADFTRALTGYYETTALGNFLTFSSNVARTGDRGLLIEPAATNQAQQNRVLANWTLTNVTSSANVFAAPDGTTTADSVIQTTATAAHSIAGPNITPLSGTTYILSAYVRFRAGAGNLVQLAGTSAAFGSQAFVNFDISSQTWGTIGTSVISYGFRQIDSGWFRIWFVATATATAGGGAPFQYFLSSLSDGRAPSFAGNTGNSDYLWGSQIETDTTDHLPSSFIGTTSASVTRPADTLTFNIPDGTYDFRFTFDDASTQTLTGQVVVGGGGYSIPTNLNRRYITRLDDVSAPTAGAIATSGSSTLSAVGRSTNAAVLATSGPGASVAFGGQAAAGSTGVINSTGKATVSLVSAALKQADLASSVGATVQFRSSATAKSVLSTTGKAAVQFVGRTASAFLTIHGEVSTLRAQAIVEMFIYDDTNIGGSQVIRWHAGTTMGGGSITWQGQIYTPFPIEATGFSVNASGSLSRPTIKAANIGGQLGAYLRSMDGAVGAKITRKRTLGRYLDAVNFVGGNSQADPTAFFPDEIFYLARKVSEDPIFLEYELAAAFDVAGVQLPRRQVIATTCEWVYRSADCGYAGPPVQDINGNPTTDANLDRCRKTLNACKARFGAQGVLNTSAFPASLLVQF